MAWSFQLLLASVMLDTVCQSPVFVQLIDTNGIARLDTDQLFLPMGLLIHFLLTFLVDKLLVFAQYLSGGWGTL